MGRKLAILSAGHFLVDFFVGFFPVYLVLAGLDLKKAGLISSITGFLSCISHPLFGFIADRVSGKAYVLLTVVGSGLVMSFFGLLPRNYALIFSVLLLGKLLNAAFHPMGSRMGWLT